MPPFLFPYPTTKPVDFGDMTHDPSGSHKSSLRDATAARARLSQALSNDNRPNPLAVIDGAQVYLPYLIGVLASLERDELLMKTDVCTFLWTSPLTIYPDSHPPYLSFPSFESERLFVLLSYILALSNYAHFILARLPDLDSSAGKKHLTADEEKQTTQGLVRAVELLSTGSGIAAWVAENVVPPVGPVQEPGRSGKGRPLVFVEASRSTFRGLASTLLADAQVVAIRKLLLPTLAHTLFAPLGPPLPKGHPAPSLLAKLHLNVSSLYDDAHANHGSGSNLSSSLSRLSISGSGDRMETIPTYLRYLKKEARLSAAQARKWLGIDAGESSRVGEGVAWIKDAQSRLKELEDSKVREKMKDLTFGNDRETRQEVRKERKGRVEKEKEEVQAWLRAYTNMNDMLSFQPIPKVESLTVPPGRAIFGAKPFKPPEGKFGTRLEGEAPSEKTDGEEYAGKGNYY